MCVLCSYPCLYLCLFTFISTLLAALMLAFLAFMSIYRYFYVGVDGADGIHECRCYCVMALFMACFCFCLGHCLFQLSCVLPSLLPLVMFIPLVATEGHNFGMDETVRQTLTTVPFFLGGQSLGGGLALLLGLHLRKDEQRANIAKRFVGVMANCPAIKGASSIWIVIVELICVRLLAIEGGT